MPTIAENRNQVKHKILKNKKTPRCPRRFFRGGRIGGPGGSSDPRSGYRPFLVRLAALVRMRWIWPRGRVTKISPIHSGFTPLIALALKLTRFTRVGDLPFSMVFR